MAKKEYKIPQKFRDFVEPILLENEEIKCTFRESFRWDVSWDNIIPKWLVLTNLRLLVLSQEIPGIRMDEFHVNGMTVELFRDNIGPYDSIDFLINNKSVYQVAVHRKRREEAEQFVGEVSDNIARFEFEQGFEGGGEQKSTPEEDKKCTTEKEHLKDLERMGAITEQEYKEEAEKPCEK